MNIGPRKERAPISFESTIRRGDDDLPVLVTASVSWCSGMDEENYQSGYIVEDLAAKHVATGPDLELNDNDKISLKEQALQEYLK